MSFAVFYFPCYKGLARLVRALDSIDLRKDFE